MKNQDFYTIDDMLQFSADEIFAIYGVFLEWVIDQKKDYYRRKLKGIWKHRTWFAFKDTNEQFDDTTMSIYFDKKRINKYTLSEMIEIVGKLEYETNHSNPKLKTK